MEFRANPTMYSHLDQPIVPSFSLNLFFLLSSFFSPFGSVLSLDYRLSNDRHAHCTIFLFGFHTSSLLFFIRRAAAFLFASSFFASRSDIPSSSFVPRTRPHPRSRRRHCRPRCRLRSRLRRRCGYGRRRRRPNL